MTEALRAAAKKLQSPMRAERDAGETVLVQARDAAIPFLVDVLTATVPFGGSSAVARASLLLCALKAREALPALFTLVEGKRVGADERPFIARALAEILDGRDAFDDRAQRVLELLAIDDDKYTRAFAAQAFAALGDLRSKSRIQALAADRDPWVREKASAVLARLADEQASAQADITPQDFAALVAQAHEQGGTLKPFLDDLGDPRRAVRDAAVNELVKAGKSAVPFLLEKLAQPNTRIRIGAAQALARLQSPEACGPLLICATTPAQTAEESELRPIALRALANSLTGLEEGLSSSLVPLAADPDRFVRAGALLCLGRLTDRAGMAAIVRAIGESDAFVVESAAVALSEGVREEDVSLVRPLLAVLEKRPEPPAAVKEAILIALSRIAVDDAPLRVRVRHRVRREVHGRTASLKKASLALLEGLYSVDDPPPLPLVDDALLRLGDEHPEVRVCAASFVRAHLEPGHTGAVARLQAALDRHERTVSLLCLEALRRHDTEDARAALERAQRDSDVGVAARALELLDGFVPQTTPWTFVAKVHAASSQPSLVETQRPPRVSRVRAVQGGGVSTVPTDVPVNAVEARFDDEPR